jgi:methylase of polypeptide subunit release factors
MRDAAALASPDQALATLLDRLDALGYDFITPTPLTHSRVLARPDKQQGRDLRDVLGWSCRFTREVLPPEVFELLEAGDVLVRDGDLWKSAIRVSRVHGRLFLHSAYPTTDQDAVFLGPDSYRFADFITAELGAGRRIGRVVDVGAGAGVGALTAAAGRDAAQVLLTDINPKAHRLARLNAAHAGISVDTVEASGLAGAPDRADLILANPPYIADPGRRTYRDGGELHGGQMSVDWAKAAVGKLAPGGRFLLYTGSAIVAGGRDRLRRELEALAQETGVALAYRELDPDVFGEELERDDYADVERIAVVGAVITKPR